MNAVDTPPSRLSRLLNVAGAVVVGFYLFHDFAPELPVWALVVAVASLASWVLAESVTPHRRTVAVVLLTVMVVTASIVVFATNGLMAAPMAVGIGRVVARLDRPLWVGVGVALLAAAILPFGILVHTVTPLALLTVECVVVVSVLAGYSRRQYRAADAQTRLLLEERLSAREDAARSEVLAERQAVARDIHDVLAHSLGGMVIQLDAVDALLEAGRLDEAASRVKDARILAAEGLAEARRAVGALRDGEAEGPVDGESVEDALGELVSAHRNLGGRIDFVVTGTAHPLGASEAQALRRAMQEALTNARRHAGGSKVDAELVWTASGAGLAVANPLPRSAASRGAVTASGAPASVSPGPVGGGHGLEGMRERFAQLRDASVSAQAVGDRFVVDARVGRA